MTEQLAENYHNAWAKKKKLELESTGKAYLLFRSTEQPTTTTMCLTRFHFRRGWPFYACALRHSDCQREEQIQRKSPGCPQIPSA